MGLRTGAGSTLGLAVDFRKFEGKSRLRRVDRPADNSPNSHRHSSLQTSEIGWDPCGIAMRDSNAGEKEEVLEAAVGICRFSGCKEWLDGELSSAQTSRTVSLDPLILEIWHGGSLCLSG